MSLVSNKKLTELTNSSDGKINEKVINFAKTFLYSQLINYINDEKLLKQIQEKLEEMSKNAKSVAKYDVEKNIYKELKKM